VYATQYSNEIVTLDQMCKGGDFESVFSFTHQGMCDLFEATVGEFDLALINPELDAARRGADLADLPAPALENRCALYHVFLDHSRRYLKSYYPTDDDVANDQAFGAWLEELETGLPHGLAGVMGDRVDLEGSARLIATFIYLASVEHEILGSGLWDYQLWSDLSPVRVYEDGRREPIDVYQRLVNANFNLNVRRTMLLDDFSTLALDDAGATAFRRFRQDLLDLQSVLDQEEPACWRMEPKRLKANINA
jgi:arachidonate 15-lipoxygenase